MQRFLHTLFLLLMAFAASRSAIAPPPGIIFLLADDLDKLAAAGAKLEHFYVLPVCTPTRAAFYRLIHFNLNPKVFAPKESRGDSDSR